MSLPLCNPQNAGAILLIHFCTQSYPDMDDW